MVVTRGGVATCRLCDARACALVWHLHPVGIEFGTGFVSVFLNGDREVAHNQINIISNVNMIPGNLSLAMSVQRHRLLSQTRPL